MMRLILNLRYTPRDRPVSSHRRTFLVENLGVLFDLATCALVVIVSISPVERFFAARIMSYVF